MLAVLQFWPLFVRAFCVAVPAHAGKRFSQNGMGLIELTSVPTRLSIAD